MALEVCPGCGCRFAVGLLRCPQCDQIAPMFTDRLDKEDPMPHITVATGPSDQAIGGATEGSTPSPGTSSSTSASRPDSNGNATPTSSDPQSPAPTTENPSSPDPRPTPASGSAGSTAGSGRGTGSSRPRRRASSTASPKAPEATPPES